MTPLDYDPAHSAGVRSLLIETAVPRRSQKRHRIWLGASLVTGLTLLGAGGAIAANYVLPGADIVTPLESAHTVTGTGPAHLDLAAAPNGTDAIETTLTCLSIGTLTWPDGASAHCTSTQDIGTGASYSMPWSSSDTRFNLGATAGTRWRLDYTFSNHQPTKLGTNANGQTYGVDSDQGHPDLIAATATNGRTGYISAREEAAAQPCSNPKTPAAAVTCSQENSGKTFTIPVYKSDGVTRIGVFEIGG